jgi:fructosamine-3-kinase
VGLSHLRRVLSDSGNLYLNIPLVLGVSETVLEMRAIEAQSANQTQMQQLGAGLALLHQVKQLSYGFKEDNYIGLNPQINCLTDNWGVFFVEYRLCYQVSLVKQRSLQKHFQQVLTQHQQTLIDFLNANCEQASLVHGDLWSGNVLFDHNAAWLIDPAAYFADREVDLAMTEMFGGFTDKFYHAYDEIYPRTAVYNQKKVLYNLYHYLNHYNLFGDAYLPACEAAFSRLKLF